MSTLILLAIILIYFFSGTHRKVMNHFGLTERDDRLMFIGFFIPGCLASIVQIVSALVALNFSAILLPLVLLLINSLFIYLNYRSL